MTNTPPKPTNVSNDEPVFVIDASIFIFRYYFSMPSQWWTEQGRPTETVYGYTLWLLRFLADIAPKRVAACFDESLGSCFRNEIYPDYKSSRVLPDEDLAFQLMACKRVTELLGISCYASPTHEADDLIGSVCGFCNKKGLPYNILTRDKDLAQLIVSENGKLWDYPDKAPQGPQELEEKLGIPPNLMADFLALVGDSSDDIPGVPGVGKKTAIALLTQLGPWQQIKMHRESIHTLNIRGAKSLQAKIIDFSEQIDMALQLTTIDSKATKVTMSALKKKRVDNESLLALAEGLGWPKHVFKKIEKVT